MSNHEQRPPGPNETIMRPGWVNPGGRPAGRPNPPAIPGPGFASPPPAARPNAPAAAGGAGELLDFDLLRGSSAGMGPLLGFLLFASRLRGLATEAHPEALRARVEAALRKTGNSLPKLGWDSRQIDLAIYFVCCAVDEAAQNTPWGRIWAERPLTTTAARNAMGGEQFFVQIDGMLRQPQAFEARLFEVAYACLATGFKGQFALQPGGDQQLEAYRESLLETIQQKEAAGKGQLFDLAIPTNRPPASANRMLPIWVPAVVSLALLAIIFVGYRALLSGRTTVVLDTLNQLAATSVTLPPHPVAQRPVSIDPSLLERIRRAARAEDWQVSEAPGVIVVTVAGQGAFASGSDQLASGASSALEEIGDAMARLRARILIRGHADAQPIRSLRFQNNEELSRARAVSVASIVARVAGREPPVEGVGEREPLCEEKTTACFARNRRVEVVAAYEGRVNAD